jgi:hypothetical protein
MHPLDSAGACCLLMNHILCPARGCTVCVLRLMIVSLVIVFLLAFIEKFGMHTQYSFPLVVGHVGAD